MKQQFLAFTDDVTGPIFALLLFMLIFIGAVGYVLHGVRNRKRNFDDVAGLPLEEDRPGKEVIS